jgi:hypothetical protein
MVTKGNGRKARYVLFLHGSRTRRGKRHGGEEAAEFWLNRLAKVVVVVVLCTMSGVDDILLLPSFVFIFLTVTGPVLGILHLWMAETGKWDIY